MRRGGVRFRSSMMDTFARCMHDLFRIFLHPLRVVSQLAERSLQVLELADFVKIIRRACTILVLCRLGAVMLRVEHGGSDGHWFSVTPACPLSSGSPHV